ncbi:DUF4019 domain-containing protein [Massilia alkalitolerans]|uniref:DUF4019 domain-containing protein n=1 Tax=Massilia alkalitolerans TaxID=286638 RepID=UPI000410427D|nr:DUF4019 domain-containing protein [Massilia alkalitolerans]
MKFAAAVLSLAVCVQPAIAQESATSTQAAAVAAEAWLPLVDGGDYAASWSRTAASFRSLVTQQQWNEAMRKTRAPYGAVRSRSFLRAHHTTSLPNAPAGEYVVIQYQTEFANKAGVETVVPMREPDGSWKVSGYYIR